MFSKLGLFFFCFVNFFHGKLFQLCLWIYTCAMGVGSSEKAPYSCLLSTSNMWVLEVQPKEVLAATHTVVPYFVYILLMCDMHKPEPKYRNKKILWIIWVSLTELRSSGLEATSSTHWDSCLAFICAAEKSVVKKCFHLRIK